MAKIGFLFVALIAGFQALPLDEENALLAEFDTVDDELTFADPGFLPPKTFFTIRDWDAIEQRSNLPQAKKFVDEKINVYYSFDPAKAMTDLAEVGELLKLAYMGSKGFKCSTPILKVMSTYQDLVKDSLIVSSTFVEIVLKALKYHKYSIMFAERERNELSIKYLRKCATMAGRMATESQTLIDKAETLTKLAVDALLDANDDFIGTTEEKLRIEKLINETRIEEARQKSLKADLAKSIAEEARLEKENSALAQESSGLGIFVKIITVGTVDLDGPKQREAARKAELNRLARIEFQKQQMNNTAGLAASVQKLMNTIGHGNNLDKSILGLDITIKTMGKVKTIFLNAKVFWTGVKKHVESLAASQDLLDELAMDAEFHEEYVEEVTMSGTSWLAVGKICRMAALAIQEVNKGIDQTMRNIPTEAEAKKLISTLGTKILKGLTEDKAEIEKELNSDKNKPKTT